MSQDTSADLPHYRSQSLPVALLRAREVLMQHFRPLLAKHDLTEQQWRVLRVLFELGPSDATSVAHEAFVLAPSLSRIIKSLEERGLILRVTDQNDGRRILLDVTQTAKDLIAHISPESRAIYKMFNDYFGTEKLNNLLVLLNEIQSMDKQNAP